MGFMSSIDGVARLAEDAISHDALLVSDFYISLLLTHVLLAFFSAVHLHDVYLPHQATHFFPLPSVLSYTRTSRILC